jgi:hypothetical protein
MTHLCCLAPLLSFSRCCCIRACGVIFYVQIAESLAHSPNITYLPGGKAGGSNMLLNLNPK